MKCRSILLIACMLVVPLLAMFSHKVPAEMRAAVRRSLRQAMAGCVGQPAEAGSPTTPPGEKVAWEPARREAPPQSAAAAAVPAGLRLSGEPAADPETAPPLVAELADRSRQARDQHLLDARLKGLGAVSLDCRPLPGNAGMYSSSCRLPVDASGQLQRVFQATAPDPVAASEALLLQVTAWLQRAAAQQPAAITARSDEQAPRGRYR